MGARRGLSRDGACRRTAEPTVEHEDRQHIPGTLLTDDPRRRARSHDMGRGRLPHQPFAGRAGERHGGTVAALQPGVEPHRAIYVGDSWRDIEAGLRAGMATVAAGYGYITEDDDPREWGADIVAPDIDELVQILVKAVNLEFL